MVVPRRIRFGALIKRITWKQKKLLRLFTSHMMGRSFFQKRIVKNMRILQKILSRIKYFCIRCNPDLTETGNFTHKIYVAVFSKHYFYRDIAFEWALRKFGYLGVSVQGYGFQTHFCVSEVSKEEYEKCPPTEWGGSNLKSDKIFLSPILVEGFPENIDYMKEWGFK